LRLHVRLPALFNVQLAQAEPTQWIPCQGESGRR
jgi:hypothetical protein